MRGRESNSEGEKIRTRNELRMRTRKKKRREREERRERIREKMTNNQNLGKRQGQNDPFTHLLLSPPIIILFSSSLLSILPFLLFFLLFSLASWEKLFSGSILFSSDHFILVQSREEWNGRGSKYDRDTEG